MLGAFNWGISGVRILNLLVVCLVYFLFETIVSLCSLGWPCSNNPPALMS